TSGLSSTSSRGRDRVLNSAPSRLRTLSQLSIWSRDSAFGSESSLDCKSPHILVFHEQSHVEDPDHRSCENSRPWVRREVAGIQPAPSQRYGPAGAQSVASCVLRIMRQA